MYLWLKTLHITFALSSAALFVWRLAWNWSGRKASGIRRWGPHLVDTLLLLSALGLVHLAMPWPLPLWLLAKLGLLLATSSARRSPCGWRGAPARACSASSALPCWAGSSTWR